MSEKSTTIIERLDERTVMYSLKHNLTSYGNAEQVPDWTIHINDMYLLFLLCIYQYFFLRRWISFIEKNWLW